MTKHLIVPVISEVSLTGENNYFTILNTSGIGLYPDRDLYVVNMWADGMMFDNLIKNMLMEKEKWTNILVESRTLNEIIYEQVLVDKMIVVSIRNIGDDISISIVVGLQNTNPVRINSSMSKIPLKGNLHKINGILFDLMEFSQHAVSSEFDFNYVKMNISKKYLYL